MLKMGDKVAFANVPMAKRLPGDQIKTLIGELCEVLENGVHVIESEIDRGGYVSCYFRQGWELSKVHV